MIRKKTYERDEPTKKRKLFYLFCEGEKTEPDYFNFFAKLASQISIQIIKIDKHNSPTGLYDNACERLIKTNQDDFNSDIDEVWFVLDTDKWENKINLLRQSVANHKNWFVAQSNRSFEVWLYYHFRNTKPVGIIKTGKLTCLQS